MIAAAFQQLNTWKGSSRIRRGEWGEVPQDGAGLRWLLNEARWEVGLGVGRARYMREING